MTNCDGMSSENIGMRLSGIRRAAFNLFNERIYNKIYTLKSIERCFCGDQKLERISNFDRFGFPFGTMVCRSCGLITIDKVLSDDDMPSFYNEIYWPLISGRVLSSFETAQESFA